MEKVSFQTKIYHFYSDLWGHHIHVPAVHAAPFVNGADRRVVCTIDGIKTFQCALMPDGKGDFFININKTIRKELDLEEGSAIIVELTKDESKYGIAVPEEFTELVKLDDEGSHYFHQLSAGKQRSLLHLIGKPKRSETRLQKAVVIFDYLKSTGGNLDYKALNQAFRDYNKL